MDFPNFGNVHELLANFDFGVFLENAKPSAVDPSMPPISASVAAYLSVLNILEKYFDSHQKRVVNAIRGQLKVPSFADSVPCTMFNLVSDLRSQDLQLRMAVAVKTGVPAHQACPVYTDFGTPLVMESGPSQCWLRHFALLDLIEVAYQALPVSLPAPFASREDPRIKDMKYVEKVVQDLKTLYARLQRQKDEFFHPKTLPSWFRLSGAGLPPASPLLGAGSIRSVAEQVLASPDLMTLLDEFCPISRLKTLSRSVHETVQSTRKFLLAQGRAQDYLNDAQFRQHVRSVIPQPHTQLALQLGAFDVSDLPTLDILRDDPVFSLSLNFRPANAAVRRAITAAELEKTLPTCCSHLELIFGQLPASVNLNLFSNLPNLRSLDVSYIPHIADLKPLAHLVGLHKLRIRNTCVKSLAPIRSLVQLRHLDFSKTRVTDIAALRSLGNLEFVCFDSCPVVEDLTPVSDKPRLRAIYIVPEDEEDELEFDFWGEEEDE